MKDRTDELADGIEQLLNNLSARIKEYAVAAKANGGVLPFARAVEIATDRMDEFHRFTISETPLVITAIGARAAEDFIPISGNWDSKSLHRLIEAAQTDYYCYLALRFLCTIEVYRTQYKDLSNWLTNFLHGDYTPPSKPKGRSKYADMHRNTIIVREIQLLSNYGIHPTRNTANDEERSGCDVINQALANNNKGLDYKSIERIWVNRASIYRSNILRETLLGSND